jgi:hypothetical protein
MNTAQSLGSWLISVVFPKALMLQNYIRTKSYIKEMKSINSILHVISRTTVNRFSNPQFVLPLMMYGLLPSDKTATNQMQKPP